MCIRDSFWAGWCMPCKMLAPSIDKLAEEYDGRATVGKVDIDEEQALAARYGVQSIPCLLYTSRWMNPCLPAKACR